MKSDIRQNLIQTFETEILRFILSGSAIFEPMISTRRVFHYPILLIFLLFSANGWAQKDPKGDLAKRRVEGESVFIDATKAEILEDLDAAFTLYQKAASLDPENAVAYFKMADILGKQNRFSEALVFSKKANEIEKKNAYFLIQLAQMQEITQDWKGAIDSYRKVMKEFPDTKFYLYSTAQLFAKNNKHKEALKELEKAETELGPSQENYQIRQRIYLSQNKFSKAVEEARNCIKAFPDNPDAVFSLCQLYMGNGMFDEAINECKALLKQFPGYAAAHLMLADVYINQRKEAEADREMELAFSSPDLPIGAKIDLVSAYLRGVNSAEDMARANRLTDLILQSHPEDPRAFLIKGDILNKQNQKREARTQYLKALVREKSNYALWEQIILIDLNLNDLDSVILHTSKAKLLFPNTPSFSFYNGLANLMTKKYSDAVESLEQARRISLDNNEMQQEIFAQLGDAYHNLKEHDKSAQAFDEALRLDSVNAHVLNNYSYFLSLEKRQLDKALAMGQRLIRLFPEDPTYLDTYGWVLYVRKEYSAAKPVLEKAAKSSNSGVIWEHYGDVLFQLGKVNEALEAWKKAAELGGEISELLAKKLKDKKLYE